MTIKSDPLAVLLAVKSEMKTELSDELLKACYQLQSEHQYDKERTTMKKMQALVEKAIASDEEDVSL
ncbi:DNA modification system-associated small protein [Endozoicomonas numazuensis]|uniref:Uncharacterized protein n=1 Tax=Endozoicomonas numazuensis TaxID=1137799 RepID=A0A081NHC2_9GAMM|nr:DNA modification system-associated small protein [Endozoicomonas numazuensis]KEQ17845.1 hypothetical protein GZ78_09330 [Endozoicomonas numazuensis]